MFGAGASYGDSPPAAQHAPPPPARRPHVHHQAPPHQAAAGDRFIPRRSGDAAQRFGVAAGRRAMLPRAQPRAAPQDKENSAEARGAADKAEAKRRFGDLLMQQLLDKSASRLPEASAPASGSSPQAAAPAGAAHDEAPAAGAAAHRTPVAARRSTILNFRAGPTPSPGSAQRRRARRDSQEGAPPPPQHGGDAARRGSAMGASVNCFNPLSPFSPTLTRAERRAVDGTSPRPAAASAAAASATAAASAVAAARRRHTLAHPPRPAAAARQQRAPHTVHRSSHASAGVYVEDDDAAAAAGGTAARPALRRASAARQPQHLHPPARAARKAGGLPPRTAPRQGLAAVSAASYNAGGRTPSTVTKKIDFRPSTPLTSRRLWDPAAAVQHGPR